MVIFFASGAVVFVAGLFLLITFVPFFAGHINKKEGE